MATTTNFALETPTPGGYRNTWGGTLNTTITKLDELVALAMPLGTIQMYPLATAPTATTNGGTWLICNGGSLARVGNYAALYALIGTTYGVGSSSDSSTFSLPDLQARVPVGYNVSAIGSGVTVRSIRTMASTADGTEAHILGATQIPKHLHPITDDGHIHPIDATTTHFHIGSSSEVGDPDGKTGMKALEVTDPGHIHKVEYVDDWASGSGTYRLDRGAAGAVGGILPVDSNTTGITINPVEHDHSLTTDAKVTGITTTQTNPVGRITTTNNQADGDLSHNDMQPYITVQYIILAKHPTFT